MLSINPIQWVKYILEKSLTLYKYSGNTKISTGGIILFLCDYSFGNILPGYTLLINSKIIYRGSSYINYNIINFFFKCNTFIKSIFIMMSKINFNPEVMSLFLGLNCITMLELNHTFISRYNLDTNIVVIINVKIINFVIKVTI